MSLSGLWRRLFAPPPPSHRPSDSPSLQRQPRPRPPKEEKAAEPPISQHAPQPRDGPARFDWWKRTEAAHASQRADGRRKKKKGTNGRNHREQENEKVSVGEPDGHLEKGTRHSGHLGRVPAMFLVHALPLSLWRGGSVILGRPEAAPRSLSRKSSASRGYTVSGDIRHICLKRELKSRN